MASFDGGINAANSAAVAADMLRQPVKAAAQVTPVTSPEPDVDVNGNAQHSSSAVGKAATERKLESLQQPERTIDDLLAAAAELNQACEAKSINLNFFADQDSQRFVVEVKESKTGQLIRTIPGEAAMCTAANPENLKGVLFDDVY